jgi:hypothetical protein
MVSGSLSRVTLAGVLLTVSPCIESGAIAQTICDFEHQRYPDGGTTSPSAPAPDAKSPDHSRRMEGLGTIIVQPRARVCHDFTGALINWARMGSGWTPSENTARVLASVVAGRQR